MVGGAWAWLDLATPFTFDIIGRAHSRPNDVANLESVVVPQPVLGFLRHLAPRSRHRVRVVASKEGHAIVHIGIALVPPPQQYHTIFRPLGP